MSGLMGASGPSHAMPGHLKAVMRKKELKEKASEEKAFRRQMYGSADAMSPEEADRYRRRMKRRQDRSTAQVATVMGGVPTGQQMGG